MLTKLILAVALVAAPTAAAARDRHVHVVVAPLSERLASIAPGTVITVPAAEWTGAMARNALDVAFGPADADTATHAVWHADGEGRDSSMRRAGLGRIVVTRTADAVTVTADAPSVAYASR